MSNQSVAYRYAKSLIDLAEERGITETVATDIKFFGQTIDENRALELALQSPVIKHYKKLAILEALFKTRVSPTTYTIFEIITRKNREAILPAIAEEFQRQYDLMKGIQKARVTSVVPLTDAQRKQLIEQVVRETGRIVELQEKLDPRLIGGYILRVGDSQVDASIRTRLNDLKVSFLRN